MTGRASPMRVAVGFALLFITYQAAEAMQTWPPVRSQWGAAVMVLALLIGWPVGRWLGWRGYDAYALDLRPRSFALLGGGFVLALLAKGAALWIGLAIGAYGHVNLVQPEQSAMPMLLGFGLLSTFVPSLAEDILTRGYPLKAAGIGWRSGLAFVLASAALYTLNHVWRLDWGWTEQLRLFCLGLAYAAAAWRFRTLWAAVALHWGWNFAGVLSDLAPIGLADETLARLVSAGIHLVLLGIVLLLPRGLAGDQPAARHAT